MSSTSWAAPSARGVVLTSNQYANRAARRPSGTEWPCPAGWLLNDTICSDDSPEAAARTVSSKDRSMRSNTASIDDVTRFSPWRYVENRGFFGIRSHGPTGDQPPRPYRLTASTAAPASCPVMDLRVGPLCTHAASPQA